MAWRLAKSLETLRSQINKHYPKRSKVSDGTIGDSKHSSRTSDHNPNPKGVVCAFDITRDPTNGPDLAKLIPLFLKDPRTKYVIYDAKIYNPTISNGAPRTYTGANAHKKHLHLSVGKDYDNPKEWALAPTGSAPQPVAPAPKAAPAYDPLRAVSFFVGRGWSEIAACAIVASLIWESGGNGKAKGQTTTGDTIFWDAKGDKDKKDGEFKSRYSAQWNGPRIKKFEEFAKKIERDVLDPYAQLAYIHHELTKIDPTGGKKLAALSTIEDANDFVIKRMWNPSIPHADKRLAIARRLIAA